MFIDTKWVKKQIPKYNYEIDNMKTDLKYKYHLNDLLGFVK